MFNELDEFMEENDLSVQIVKTSITIHFQALLEHFDKYFPEETALEQFDCIKSPFTLIVQRISSHSNNNCALFEKSMTLKRKA